MLRHRIARDVAASLDHFCDILGNVISPMLQRVECHDANRIIELSCQKIVDDSFNIGSLDFGLAIVGCFLRARLGPHRAPLRRTGRVAAPRVGPASPAKRRPGRGLPERRPRLEHGRVADGSVLRRPGPGIQRSLSRGPPVRRERLRAGSRRLPRYRPEHRRPRRRGLHLGDRPDQGRQRALRHCRRQPR